MYFARGLMFCALGWIVGPSAHAQKLNSIHGSTESRAITPLGISSPTTQQLAPSGPQAAQLLRRALTAQAQTTASRDVTLSGTAHYIAGSDDETGTATLRATAAGASRLDLNLSSGQRSEINNSSTQPPTGKWSGADGASHDVPFHNLLTEPAWFYPAFLVLRGLSAPGYVATYVGRETLNDQIVEHLKISQAPPVQASASASTFTHLTQTDLFLDASTFLPAAMAFNIHPDNNELLDIPVEVRFSDYRSVNGIRIPFHVQKFLNNGLLLDLQFQNAAINSGLAANEFAIQ